MLSNRTKEIEYMNINGGFQYQSDKLEIARILLLFVERVIMV